MQTICAMFILTKTIRATNNSQPYKIDYEKNKQHERTIMVCTADPTRFDPQLRRKNIMRINKKLPKVALCFAFVITFIAAGCGENVDKGPTRYKVSGTVTFEGKSVPFGTIMFTPDSAKGNKGPQGFAEIVDGKFDTTNGQGIVGGAHQIKITGVSEKADPTAENPPDKSLFKPFKTTFDFPKEDSTKDFVVK